MRHAFASRVLSCTGNIRVAQKLLGHKRMGTAEIYTHPTREDLRQAVESAADDEAQACGVITAE